MQKPLDDCAITVVIPARNEAHFIERTVKSVLASEGVGGAIEVLVVDGGSTDETPGLIERLAAKDDRVRLIRNPARYTPHALNIGVRAARGQHIMILGAHAEVTPCHLVACADALDRGDADIVGGLLRTLPKDQSDAALAVWCVMTHRFGLGPSRFRTGTSVPIEVDTVAFAMIKRSVFEDIGLFDEDLVRGQDDEFNARARRAGKRILLLPQLTIAYHARADIPQLSRMCFQYAVYKPVSNIKAGKLINVRQFVPSSMLAAFSLSVAATPIFPSAAIIPGAILSGYAAIAMTAAASAGRTSPSFVLRVFTAFVAAHVGYGLGYLKGIVALLRFGKGAAHALSRSVSATALTR